MMKIIEKYINSKTGDIADCEDKIFISDDFIAVIDGATSKTDFKYKNKTPGALAAEIIANALKALSKYHTAYKVVDIISNAIYKYYEENSLLATMNETPENRLSASVVIYSIHLREIWMVGDCQAMINYEKISNSKKVDEILSDVRSLFIDMELESGKSIKDFQEYDYAREYIKPLLLAQSKLQNNHNAVYGYSVIDGYQVQENDIKIHQVSEQSSIVILASDGYPVLQNNLNDSEYELEKILKEDPLLFKKYKSTKGLMKSNISYDDRSYIRFSID